MMQVSKKHSNRYAHNIEDGAVCGAHRVFKRRKRNSEIHSSIFMDYTKNITHTHTTTTGIQTYIQKCTSRKERGRGVRKEKLRAAIERKALERGRIVFGFGATPLCCPLRLRYEHSIFAVLLLPHFATLLLPLPLLLCLHQRLSNFELFFFFRSLRSLP